MKGDQVKKFHLEKSLLRTDWYLLRHGGKHDIWTNGLGDEEAIPRHSEINEKLAKKILRKAESLPGKAKGLKDDIKRQNNKRRK